MKNFKSLLNWKIILASLLVYNLVPLFMFLDNSVGAIIYGIGSLIFINPVYIFSMCLVQAEKANSNVLMPILLVVLFIPTIFIFYNSTALVYIIIYFVLSYLGTFIGTFIKKTIKKTV